MLDYAKAQAGQVELALQTVSLPDLVQQCVAISEVRAKENGVPAFRERGGGVAEITADPLRLKQALLNLLSNAVKFTPQQGLVKVQVRKKDSDVLIGVRDTGRGISPEKMQHLFDPYHQAERGPGAGTGLGLAITKFLVELHGGSISVDSAPGSGSLFTLRLPVQGATPAQRKSDKLWSEVTGDRSAAQQRERAHLPDGPATFLPTVGIIDLELEHVRKRKYNPGSRIGAAGGARAGRRGAGGLRQCRPGRDRGLRAS